MAAKVGGIYVSLALNTAEFSGGVDKSVAEMRKFDKLQADMGKAVGRVNAQISQQASVMAQLALQGTKLGPMIALIATGTQKYYQAMKRAAGANEAFSRSGASFSALLQSMKANWVALTVQVAKYGIDKILEWQLKKAQKIADEAQKQADAMEKRTERAREKYKQELEDRYNYALGIEKKITVAEIIEETIRTKNYVDGRKKAAALIAKDAAKKSEDARKEIARALMSDTDRQIDDIKDKYNELIEKADTLLDRARLTAKKLREVSAAEDDRFRKYLDDILEKEERIKKMTEEAESKRLSVAQKMVAAWREQIALATRYASLVVGRASGAYSAMLGSAEAMGRISGMPAMATGGSSPAMQFNTTTMEGYLKTIADAARKELTL